MKAALKVHTIQRFCLKFLVELFKNINKLFNLKWLVYFQNLQMTNSGNDSVFARSMAVQEEALKFHQETDSYLQEQKRQILLNILKSIKEDPPSFLVEQAKGHSIQELESYIQRLESIPNSQ